MHFKEKSHIAIIGNGRWGTILSKYCKEIFTVREQFGNNPIILENVLSDKSIESVVIATPPFTHFQLVKRALSEGKNVFCEKPLSMRYSEVVESGRCASENGLALVIDYTHTFSLGLKKCRSFIRSSPGEKVFVEVIINKEENREISVITALLPHALSIVNMFVNLRDVEFKEEVFYRDRIPVECSLVGKRIKVHTSLRNPRRFLVRVKKGDICVQYNPEGRNGWTIIAESFNKVFFKQFQDESNNLREAFKFFNKAIQEQGSNIETEKGVSLILEGLERRVLV